MKPDTEKVLSILASHENDPSNLIAILQDVQAEYNYLSEANLTLIADTLGLSVSKVYSVATFYENFSLEAKGKHIVKVCAGTACHVRKSGPIYDAIYEYLGLHGKKKTSDDGLFTLETVACLGACGLAPVMTVDGEVHAKMDPERAIELLETIRKGGGASVSKLTREEFRALRTRAEHDLAQSREVPSILICAGTGCIAGGAMKIYDNFKSECEARGLKVYVGLKHDTDEEKSLHVKMSGCHGFCEMGPLVHIEPMGVMYIHVKPEDCHEILEKTVLGGEVIDRLVYHLDGVAYPKQEDIPFYKKQHRVVLENCGTSDAEDIEEYIAKGGYSAFEKALFEMTDEQICRDILDSGLRGRGGGGFPAGRKWDGARKQKSAKKYIVCNGDEGDPGAFMDRSVMEGNPHSVLEGMMIAGLAVGSDEGYIYVRAEYPLAVNRLKTAIAQRRGDWAFSATNILGSDFNFRIHVNKGAGAFVCGEGSALTASIEGNRGMPRVKPPRTIEHGLWAEPTVLNNVETFANVPLIIKNGVEWYHSIGTEKSPGTKAFALTGNVVNTGLIEVPMGTTIREVVFDIGGGIPERQEVQGRADRRPFRRRDHGERRAS